MSMCCFSHHEFRGAVELVRAGYEAGLVIPRNMWEKLWVGLQQIKWQLRHGGLQ